MAQGFARNEDLLSTDVSLLEDLYQCYQNDPQSVDPSWIPLFTQMMNGNITSTHTPSATKVPLASVQQSQVINRGSAAATPQQATLDSIRAMMLIRAYRVRGHLQAQLDPLGLEQRQEHPELDPATYGFTAQDYDRPIYIHGRLGQEYATLNEIVAILKQTYADTIGFEFMHIQDPQPKDWIQRRIENRRPILSADAKKSILTWLCKAEAFEKFLAVKYPGAKRFGLEGGESTIPALATILYESTHHGLQEVVLGMAHRGRLNVVANILGKPCRAIFSQFQGKPAHPEDVQGSGDVKYHLGASSDREFNGQKIHLSLTANPSHLEAVNPVVIGKVRAKQTYLKDDKRDAVMGVLLHGDAAFAGQGLVTETLLLSDLRGYQTGGTIHIIINNQIGFTTSPHYSRSSPYSSDNIKAIQAPVVHVNGDDPEAVYWVAQLAAAYRQEFKKDVLIDLFCYRRHGHNEMDEPSFTQPLMYQKIRNQPTTRELYAQKLVAEGIVSADDAEGIYQTIQAHLQQEFDAASDYKASIADWLEGAWSTIDVGTIKNADADTDVSFETLQAVGQALTTVPQGFDLNSKLVRLLDAKKDMFKTGEGVDWATAEALAFGTLVLENIPVRLSGQDCGRGTFSQRHAMLFDQTTGQPYKPLSHVHPNQADFDVLDSPLAEASVLGFELGYSLANPQALVIWEAQFGDFSNCAQVIIDQFIASGEVKWLRMSGLVLLLPHGYEGQGPEHSSARLERYLQLCAEDNMQVANCTTAANYFHILRRQLKRRIRKPLVIMTPKSLLRDKRVASKLTDMGSGSQFMKIIPEVSMDLVTYKKIRRVVLCSGKVYYDLVDARDKTGIKDIVVIRLEQLYPFPAELLKQQLSRYPQAEVVWVQEEPQNMGAWTFVDRRLETVMRQLDMPYERPQYCGRPEAAATATGSHQRHEQEQQKLIEEALSIKSNS